MFSERVRSLELSGIRKMFEAAPPHAINLGLGEPDFNPPKVVQEALVKAVHQGLNKYGPSAGLPELREAIAKRYRRYGGTVSRENVMVTAGGSEALIASALALYDPGDEVLIPNPGFVLYGPHARLAGATPIPYSLREDRKYQPDLDELGDLVTPRTRALVVNSPSNPLGSVFSRKTVDALVDFAEDHRLTIVSDEVYDEIVYSSSPFTSFYGRTDRTVVVNSFSKIFAMTGWRLGYVVAPRGVIAEINKIHYHLMACPSTPCQVAATAGLAAPLPEVAAMVKEFKARRDLIVRSLNRIPGMHAVTPEGAFYVFPRFDWSLSALETAQGLLKHGLICTPGDAFGSLGAAHLRFSFANSRANIERAMTTLEEFAREQTSA